MSRLRSAVVALALCVAGAVPAVAQSSADARGQSRIVDSLVAMWRRATAELTAYNDTAYQAVVMDTVRASNVRLVVDRVLLERGRTVASMAAKEVDRIAGSASAPLVDYPITLRRRSIANNDTLVLRMEKAFHIYGADYRTGEQWGAVPDSTLVAWVVSSSIWLLSMDAQVKDRVLDRWMSRTIVPDTVNTETWTGLRLNLVSGDPSIGRNCYSGDMDACHHVLGLKESADPIRDHFNAADRRRVVARDLKYIHVADRLEANRCVNDGDDAACLIALRRRAMQYEPGNTGHNESLVRLAMSMGGPGGYQRFLSTRGTPAQRLAAAAGVPVENVVMEWQRRIVETRLPSQDMSSGIAVSSLLWIFACGALALRSTRWR